MNKFIKITLTNFLSWRGTHHFYLDKQGMVLVEGENRDHQGADSNMSGKSSILEGLLWGLYGRTIRQVRHNEVVNRFVKADCRVSVQFRSRGNHYEVIRYRMHHKYKNRLLFRSGTRRLEYRHESDTQARIEGVLGANFQTFVHTTVFGGPKPFATLTDAEQKKVLESFLHFERIDLAYHRTRKILDKTVLQEHELEINLAKAETSTRLLRSEISLLKKGASLQRSSENKRRKELEVRAEKAQRQYRENRRVRNRVLHQLNLKGVEAAADRVRTVEHWLGASAVRLESYQRRLENLERKLSGKEKLVGKRCPVCKKGVTSDDVEDMLHHFRVEHEKIRKRKVRTKKRIEDLGSLLKPRQKVLKRVELLFEQKREDLQRINELEQDLAREKHSKGSTFFTSKLENTTFNYGRACGKLLVLKQSRQELEKKIKDLKFWIVGFGNKGVKALIVRSALPALNAKLKEYAEKIYNGSVEMQFRPSKETKSGEERELFHLHYKSRVGSSTYLGESSGGRKRADICVLLVFNWLTSSSNLLIVDELLDGLDETGQDAILEILASLRGTVLVISHSKDVKSKLYSKVWTVVKEKKNSRLEIDNV